MTTRLGQVVVLTQQEIQRVSTEGGVAVASYCVLARVLKIKPCVITVSH